MHDHDGNDRFYKVHLNPSIGLDNIFEHRVLNIFLSISYKICFGCSKESSH